MPQNPPTSRRTGALSPHRNPARKAAALIIALVSLLASFTGIVVNAPAAHADAAADGQFTPLWQTPLVDTRTGFGTDSGQAGKIPANGSITFQVVGKAGIPTWGVKAVSTTITVHDPTDFGWLSVFPSDIPTELSTVTFAHNESVTGSDFTQITPTQRVTIFNHSNVSVDASVSADGYFRNADQADGHTGYWPVPTSVLYDSRNNIGAPARNSPIPAGGSLTIDVAGRNNIGWGAAAAALNVVTNGQTANGNLGIHPSDAPTSAPVMDFVTGEQDSAFTVAQMSETGKLTIENNSGGTVHVSISVRGWFTWGDAGSAASYFPVPTKLVLETLDGTGVTVENQRPSAPVPTGPVASGKSITFNALGGYSPTWDRPVAAVAMTINSRRPSSDGFLSVFPGGSADTSISSVSFTKDESNVSFDTVIPNEFGQITIANHSPGTVHLQVVVRGYYLTPLLETIDDDGATGAEVPISSTVVQGPQPTPAEEDERVALGFPCDGVGHWKLIPYGKKVTHKRVMGIEWVDNINGTGNAKRSFNSSFTGTVGMAFSTEGAGKVDKSRLLKISEKALGLNLSANVSFSSVQGIEFETKKGTRRGYAYGAQRMKVWGWETWIDRCDKEVDETRKWVVAWIPMGRSWKVFK